MREELKKLVPNETVRAQLYPLALEATNRIGAGEDATNILFSIQQITGNKNYNKEFFRDIYGASDPADFALRAAYGKAEPLYDLTFDELVEIIEEISINPSEKTDHFLKILEATFPKSEVSNLIYWAFREMSYAETANEILERQRIVEEGGPELVETRIKDQARAALENPDSPMWAVMSAKWTLGITEW